MKNIEVERKFLIKKPSKKYLESNSIQIYSIEQIYLETSEKNSTSRIRKTTNNGKIQYYHTKKTDIDAYRRFEEEKNISKSSYTSLSKLAKTLPLKKNRYLLMHHNWVLEIDVYPFWKDQAILEIENLSEGEDITFPDTISVIKEVTTDQEYSNYSLAVQLSIKT